MKKYEKRVFYTLTAVEKVARCSKFSKNNWKSFWLSKSALAKINFVRNCLEQVQIILYQIKKNKSIF